MVGSSMIASTKSQSFCMTTFIASLTNLAAVLPQSRDCSCYARTSTSVAADTHWSTRTRFRAPSRLATSA